MFGTLTALPVPAPTSVDRRTAGTAMLLAPLGGLVLAVPLVLLASLDAAPLLVAALVVAGLALLTRALHLDGLADTADGLGSGRRGAEALAVMRQSDIGPFGVVTLLLALVVQVVALASLQAVGLGPATVLAALVVSRGVLPLLCTSWFPPARADGLGSAVAGTVPRGAAVASLLVAALVAVLAALALVELAPGAPGQLVVPDDTAVIVVPGRWFADAADPSVVTGAVLLAAAAAVVIALLLARRCVRRFGGVTGDVYGACVELGFTTLLVVLALALT
jgi:adenosylcobinamide-GDP ribazoletransferase